VKEQRQLTPPRTIPRGPARAMMDPVLGTAARALPPGTLAPGTRARGAPEATTDARVDLTITRRWCAVVAAGSSPHALLHTFSAHSFSAHSFSAHSFSAHSFSAHSFSAHSFSAPCSSPIRP
jgi:hypothetical protein